MPVLNVRSARYFPAPRKATLRLRVLMTALLTVGGFAIIPATTAEAAVLAPGCPSGTAGRGGKVIIGTAASETIKGTLGDDWICGGAGNDVIDGGGGDDHIFGGPGNDTIYGGVGNDWLEGGADSDTIDGGSGSDQIFGEGGPAFEGVVVPTARAGNDVILGGTGADNIEGGSGNDIIQAGGVGSANIGAGDVVHGGPGNDVLLSDFRQLTGSDSFFGDEGDDVVWPNPLRLNPLGNVAWGGPGNDLIITANGMQDGVALNEPKGLSLRFFSVCKLTIPLLQDAPVGSKAVASCAIPKIGNRTVNATVGTNKKLSFSGTLFGTQVATSSSQWGQVARGGFPADICVCDPKISDWPTADLVS